MAVGLIRIQLNADHETSNKMIAVQLAALCLLSAVARGELNCFEHFKCLSTHRSTEFLQHMKLNSSIPNWLEMCNCDQYCHVFGDCCEQAPILESIQLEQWSFVKVRLSSKISFMSLMKNRCPKGFFGNSMTKTMCEHSNWDTTYDYLMPEMEHYLLLSSGEEFKNWHVTGRHSLVTYRNIYCSICNNETQVDSWYQRLMCPPLGVTSRSTHDTSHCTAIYHQAAPDVIGKEKLKRSPLQNKVSTACNLGWYKANVKSETYQVLQIVKKCLIYYMPVVVQDKKSKKFIVFKNPYCALCNGYDYVEHQCPNASIDQKTQVPMIFNLNTNFDTNYRDGAIIDRNSNQSCMPGNIYNPLIGRCFHVDFPSSQYSRGSGSVSTIPLAIVLHLLIGSFLIAL